VNRLALTLVLVSLPFAACGKKTPPEPQKVTEAADTEKVAAVADTEKVAAVATDDAKSEPTTDVAPGVEPPPTEAPPTEAPKVEEPPVVVDWMSWDGGVDFAAMTADGLAGPNVIFHIARVVHTPIGSAPSGMILYQPDPAQPPVVAGFVSGDETVGAYFGPKIFAGTPFEKAPAMKADISVEYDAATAVATATVKVGEHTFKASMSEVGAMYRIDRVPGPMTPFQQQGVEAKAGKVTLEVDGAAVNLIMPPMGVSGGPPAVWAATGIYSR